MSSTQIDLNEFITGQEQAFVRLLGGGISLRVIPAGKPVRVSLDEAALRPLVATLLEQARQLLPGGGAVQLQAEVIEVDETHARIQPGARRGNFARLTVRDNGLGLRADALKRLFTQTSGGTAEKSLSLPGAAGMVERRQGWLEAISQEGCGTEFRIYFPQVTGVAAMTEIQPARAQTKETILLVDDEDAIRRMVKTVLQRASYEVIEAETGVQALKIWEDNKERVNLLLTDMVMPDGVTGRELAQRLQRTKPDLNVIYTSGFELDPAALQDTRQGVVRFLQKPYDVRCLLETVRAALAEGMASGGNALPARA